MTGRPASSRKSLRLPRYDYSETGGYFITLVSHERQCLFGEISISEMHLSPAGEIVLSCWKDLPAHYPHIGLDAMAIMPNHLHAIVCLVRAGRESAHLNPYSVGAGLRPAPTGHHGLPEIVRALKAFSSRRINEWRGTPGVAVWQRNYFEHIVRDEGEMNAIRQYIEFNPKMWAKDRENRNASPPVPEFPWHV